MKNKMMLKDFCEMNHASRRQLKIIKLDNQKCYESIKDLEVTINKIDEKAFCVDFIDIAFNLFLFNSYKELDTLINIIKRNFQKIDSNTIYFDKV